MGSRNRHLSALGLHDRDVVPTVSRRAGRPCATPPTSSLVANCCTKLQRGFDATRRDTMRYDTIRYVTAQRDANVNMGISGRARTGAITFNASTSRRSDRTSAMIVSMAVAADFHAASAPSLSCRSIEDVRRSSNARTNGPTQHDTMLQPRQRQRQRQRQ
jgi:hypothetical protein